VTRQDFTEAFRNGVCGWVDYDHALLSPWGFDVSEIRIPTLVIYGATDVFVPKRHGEWLAANVPNADVVVEQDLGHMGHPDLVAERLAWLVRAVDRGKARVARS
jgi:pimeloyl-ACP methyl ester carboxylesterase